MIFPDQWRGDCLGGLGHPVVDAPFLDQLMSEGVTFTSAYSAVAGKNGSTLTTRTVVSGSAAHNGSLDDAFRAATA